MCMEGINIGRKSYKISRTFAGIAAGTSQAFGQADSRTVSWIVATDGTQRINAGWGGVAAANLFDIITGSWNYRVYSIEDFGNEVMNQLNLRNTGAASADVCVTQVIYDAFVAPARPGDLP